MIVNFAQPAYLSALGPPWVFTAEAAAVQNATNPGDECLIEVIEVGGSAGAGVTLSIGGTVDDV